MTTPEEAANAATALRQHLVNRPAVQLVDICSGADTSHYVRVWVSQRTPEIVDAVPGSMDGVAVRIVTLS